jgi:hypothetical protein
MSKRNAMQQELALKLPFLRALEAIQLAERAGEQGRHPTIAFATACELFLCFASSLATMLKNHLLAHANAGTPSLLFNLLAEKQPQVALLHLFRAAFSKLAQEWGGAEDPAGGRGSTTPASIASEGNSGYIMTTFQHRCRLQIYQITTVVPKPKPRCFVHLLSPLLHRATLQEHSQSSAQAPGVPLHS